MKIALDAMGGDFAPERPVAAAVEALAHFPQIEKLLLYGKEAEIRAELKKLGQDKPNPRLEIHHCDTVIEMGDPPVESLRRKKNNSILRCIEAVRDQQADAAVSAGHTGAMVAAAGIATIMPTETNLFILIDAGANIDARPEHLLDYALMGSIFSEEILGYKKPRVGLLSIGSEDAKGNTLTKDTFKLLSEAPINFVGNIEGRDLFERPVDVVVCDGFVGNVVLKTGESIATAIFHWLAHEIKKTPFRMLGAWLARNAFRAIKKKTNYEEYGGSLLLGVNGITVIAHGSSTVKAIRNAIREAVEAVEHGVNDRIIRAAEIAGANKESKADAVAA
jgi:glycerol-3-phosphate acyltransferase PlsX